MKTRYVLGLMLAVVILLPPYYVKQAIGAGDPIWISPEWQAPKEFGAPINSSAWEDGPSISPDGRVLFFSRGRDRDVNTWVAWKTSANKWCEPAPLDVINVESFPTGALHTQDCRFGYFASIRPGGMGLGDIYLIDASDNDVENLGPPVNTAAMESEPYISPDGRELYFASNRKGGRGDLDIWMARKQGSGWSQPVNLGSPINSDKLETQPFVTQDGQEMYFMAVDRERIGGPAIFRSHKQGDGWSRPEVVVSGLVGEPTLTADAKYLYFVHIIRQGNKLVDAQIMFAPHK